MSNQKLRVFVSSKMNELSGERKIIQVALQEILVDAWIFEIDAGARPTSIRETYLEELSNCDLYIGVFWKSYGEYSVEEYDYATKWNKDCLIYEKRTALDKRDPKLQEFLDKISKIDDGVTIKWFTDEKELSELVKQDVARWQVSKIRALSPINNIVNRQVDWGNAPEVNVFFGRSEEIVILEKWILEDSCKIISILGMAGIGKTRLSIKLGKGGIGKTDLSLKLAKGIQDEFDFVIWRSLLNAPPLIDILSDVIKILSLQQDFDLSNKPQELISKLLSYLQKNRCLLILDNMEAILESGNQAGEYMEGYSDYGLLLKHLGTAEHKSCLLITSREKPKDIYLIEGRATPVRTLELAGLDSKSSKDLLKEYGDFNGTEEEWHELIEFYNGNPLALELAAKHISEVFFGNIGKFLHEGKPVFNDLSDLLDWHFNRLSEFEIEALYWLTINREPLSHNELKEDIVSSKSKKLLSSTLQTLQRRIPIEKISQKFTLQPVLIEYITDKIISIVENEIYFSKYEYEDYFRNKLINNSVSEIIDNNIKIFPNHSLLKATSKDYIRESQIRLIIFPIVDQLITKFGDEDLISNTLMEFLTNLKIKANIRKGYAAGNILNLLIHLGIDLKSFDFSNMAIWQAYLRGVELHDTNFSYSDLSKSVFTETFGLILSIAFDPTGTLLATGSGNSNIQLWKVPEGKQIIDFKGHNSWVVSLAFSPDGNLLASGSNDQTIKIWDLETRKCLNTLTGFSSSVRSVAFNHNGSLLASGSEDQTIRIWETETGNSVLLIDKTKSPVRTVTFHPHNNLLASGGSNNLIQFWDINTGELIKELKGHKGWVRTIDFSPDGNCIVSGSSDKLLKIWNTKTGECILTMEGHTDSVMVVRYSYDGKKIVSSSNDKTVKVWDAITGKCLQTLQGHTSWVRALDFGKPNNLIASGSDDLTVKIWDSSTGHCLSTLIAYINPMWSIDFHPNEKKLASCSNGKIWLWDSETGKQIGVLLGHTHRIWSISYNSKRELLASGSDDLTVRIWDTKTNECIHTFNNHSKRIWSVDFNPEGNLLASAGEDKACIWNVITGQYLGAIQENISVLRVAKFSPDGKYLATGGEDAILRIWEIEKNNCIFSFEGHENWIWDILFMKDQSRIVSSGDDADIRIWDINNGNCLAVLSGHTDQIKSISISPDDRFLASGSADNTVRVWDMKSGTLYRTLEGHLSCVWSVKFDPLFGTLASCSEDEMIKFWDIDTGKCIKTLKSKRPYEGVNITGTKGLTEAQKENLINLGAIEENKKI